MQENVVPVQLATAVTVAFVVQMSRKDVFFRIRCQRKKIEKRYLLTSSTE
jgi:hypothetical protein